MKKIILSFCFLSALFSQFAIHSNLENKLTEVQNKYIDLNAFSGSVGLLAVNGEIVYHKAVGFQDIESKTDMTIHSLHRIASMTKPIITLAFLRLVDQGKISINDPVEKHLPYVKGQKVLVGKRLEPLKTPLLIKHLLTHTSGIATQNHPVYKNVDFSKSQNLDQYVRSIFNAPLVNHPGEQFIYTKNTDVIARIVEVIEGKSIDYVVQRDIFHPLGMKNTFFKLPKNREKDLASVYKYDQGSLKKVNQNYYISKFPRGSNGLISSTEDYFKFAMIFINKGLVNNKQIVSEKSLQLMMSNQLNNEVLPLKIGPTSLQGLGFSLGLGVSINNNYSTKELTFGNFGNLPKNSVIWPGITNTFWWADPDNKIIGVLLTQSASAGIFGNFQDFTQTFYTSFYNLN